MAITRVGYTITNSGGLLDFTVTPPAGTMADDWLIALVSMNPVQNLTPPAGWTALFNNVTAGTLGSAVFVKKRAIGEGNYAFHVSSGLATVALMAFRGVADTGWVVGTGRTRATTGSTFNNIADPITTTVANSLVLTLSNERTTASETAISMTGATQWFFQGNPLSGGVESVAAGYVQQTTAGASSAVTIVYPNTQPSNGWAVQLGLPPAGAVATPPGLKGSIWTGTLEAPLYATKWTGTTEVPVTSFAPYTGDYHWSDLFSTEPFYIAHRGGGANWPEHTMRSYSSAVNYGMKAIEISTHITSDGVIVCHHDNSTLRMTGVDLNIETSTKAQLDALTNTAAQTDNPGQNREPIPTLASVLAAYASNHVLFIEPKTGGTWHPTLMNMIDSYPNTANRIVWKQPINSSEWATAKARGYMTWGYVLNTDTAHTNNLGTLIPQANLDYIGVERIASDAFVLDVVARANAVGKKVIMWEIRSIADRDRALALGCVGMMTSNLRATLPKFP
jgi:glycerophosphoryl diester phosphodiesterase